MKPPADTNNLFHRVTVIIEQARSNVVRSVNIQMVIAYWLIGREIVEEEQHGSAQAGYGDYLIRDLSKRLGKRYGKGYSVTNLKYFRQFYLTYRERTPQIGLAARGRLPATAVENGHAARDPFLAATGTSDQQSAVRAAFKES